MNSADVRDRLQKNLGARYHVERELGRGGMAFVYLARDVRHDRLVALKVLVPEVAFALGHERFLREILFAARLSHPHILTVHDSGDADGLLYYVMPFVEGESLRERLDRDGSLPIEDVMGIAHDVADALGYAHASGVVHRDIKPENILLSHGHAMVADFGIASAVDTGRDDRLTATGISLGTPAYMSPEQALAEDTDARTDVWALGCVIYEMLAGAPPFGREPRQVISRVLTSSAAPIRDLRPDVPSQMEHTIEGALTRRLEDRIPSGAEFLKALDAWEPEPRRLPAGLPGKKWRIAVIAGTAALIASAGMLLLRGGTSQDGKRQTGLPSISGSGKSARLSADSIARQLYLRGEAQQARRTNAGSVEAMSLFSRAIGRDSSFALAWAGLSRTAQYAAMRGFAIPNKSADSLNALAFSASERAVELDSDNAEIWLVRAAAAGAVDPTDRSAMLYAVHRALAIDSTNSSAWAMLALCREELLNSRDAEIAWRRSASLDPKNVLALSFMGVHYVWTHEFEKGVPWADSAIALDPTYVVARGTAAQLALELGRPDDAERQVQAFLRLTSGRQQVDGFTVLVGVDLARGDTTAARSYALRAARLSNVRKPTRHESASIGAAFAELGDTARALRWLAAYQPRGDLHFQLHLKRDPNLAWLKGPRGRALLTPDPPATARNR